MIGRMATRTTPNTDSRLAARLAALASLGAAVIHFAVVPSHWQEWMPAGVFFALLAVVQLMWAGLVLTRPTVTVLAAGIVLNVGVVALWAFTRTAGAPFGPHAGVPEVVQAADLCALLLQIYVVMGAGWVVYRGLRGEPVSVLGSAVVLLGAVCLVTLASTIGVASGLRHGHHAPAEAGSGHHSGPHVPAEPGPVVVDAVRTPQAPAPVDAPVPAAEPLHDHGAHEHGG